MVILRVIQGIFIVYALVIGAMFFLDYRKNKETNVPIKQQAANGFIGFVTNFFDTLGIGSFAPTMAIFKLFRLVPDNLIPGTMNVGCSIPVILETLLFITVIEVDVMTLALMLIADVIGALVGVKFARKLPIRGIRTTMAIGLLLAAVLMVCNKFGLVTAGGAATGLGGARLLIGVVCNFILGCLLPLGIGNYAPCMVIVYMLGMSSAVAFPIMMGSAAVGLSTASVRFIKEGCYHRKAAWGLTVLGIPGVLIAAFLVKSMPLSVLQWLVIGIVLYTSFTMFRQVFSKKAEPKVMGEEVS